MEFSRINKKPKTPFGENRETKRAFAKYFTNCLCAHDLIEATLKLMDDKSFEGKDVHIPYEFIMKFFDSGEASSDFKVLDGEGKKCADEEHDVITKDNFRIIESKEYNPEDYSDCDSDCDTDLEEDCKIKYESKPMSRTVTIEPEEDFSADCDDDSDMDV